MKKSVLITGANKSIGFETARVMGKRGYKVWLGCRDLKRGEHAVNLLLREGIDAGLAVIDVTHQESIDKAVQLIDIEDSKLDVLINNAGIPGTYPVAPDEQNISDIMEVYDTNVFGAIRVTQAFLPLLKSGEKSRIIMVSSGLGSLEWVSDPTHFYSQVAALGYTSSKTALNGVTVSFANALSEYSISVNAVDPGYTATDFNGHTGHRSIPEAVSGIVWLAAEASQDITAGFFFDRKRAPW